jgi:hypothetical protein
MNKPLVFKVRTVGHYTGKNGGKIKKGTVGSGMLWSDSKAFTVNTVKDQYLMLPESCYNK